jgi:hypothetical protein
MIKETIMRGTVSVREKAVLAWEHERPTREAIRLERRAKQIAALREKLKGIFGEEYEIKVGIDANKEVIATVEDLRFIAITYTYDHLISISLIEKCSGCGKEIPIGIVSNLADIGEALEEFAAGLRHECD